MIRSPFGMVICAGPTGSGKTTTLYATLTEINAPERNIMTIEDPVEYVFPSINQIQINEQAGITFAGGLRSILRQDPDVILVGEIRDVETARIAVQSALTGHFVLSSLHAHRRGLGAAPLPRHGHRGLPHRLVGGRRRRPAAGAPDLPGLPGAVHADAEELAFYQQAGGSRQGRVLPGEGCNFCAHTGYYDRIGVYELLRITAEIARADRRLRHRTSEMRRLAVAQGMRTAARRGVRLRRGRRHHHPRSRPHHLHPREAR